RVWTAIKVAGMYLWLMVWPGSLSANYSFDSISLAHTPLDPAVAVSALVWGSLLALAVWAIVREARLVLLSLSLLVFPFLPVSNLFAPIGTIMGERLFYLPSAGLCLLAGIPLTFILSPGGGEGRVRGIFPSRSSHFTLHVLRFLLVIVCLALTIRTAVR